MDLSIKLILGEHELSALGLQVSLDQRKQDVFRKGPLRKPQMLLSLASFAGISLQKPGKLATSLEVSMKKLRWHRVSLQIYCHFLTALFTIAKTQNHVKYLSGDKQIKKMCHTHSQICTHTQRNIIWFLKRRKAVICDSMDGTVEHYVK